MATNPGRNMISFNPVRLVLTFIVVYLGVMLLSGLAGVSRSVPTTLIVLNPVAETRAVEYATAGAASGSKGIATAQSLSKVVVPIAGAGLSKNLGSYVGNPRVVQYTLLVQGLWVKVCVVAPKPASAAYPVVCPGS
jgi:hypothetical protein